MKRKVIGLMSVVGLAVAAGSWSVEAQTREQAIEAHRAAAKAAAGNEHAGIYSVICTPEATEPGPPPPPRQGPPRPEGPPPRSAWYTEPVKVFDNLYYVGMNDAASWAITTSAGIILIDTIFDFSVEDEIVQGLRKFNLDPAQIKYAIVSHGHDDHFSGAKYLQDRFGARILLSAADWDLVESAPPQAKPKRDMVVTDGQTLTLGDTTLTLYITPGHTAGTVSTLVPVRDGGKPHMAMQWGGTSFGWMGNRRPQYVTPDRSVKWWFETYGSSARRMRDVAAKAGVDVILGNHPIFDGGEKKLPAMATRKPGGPHPYVIGADSVKRYLTVADECAQVGLLRQP